MIIELHHNRHPFFWNKNLFYYSKTMIHDVLLNSLKLFFFQLFENLVDEGKTILVVTHDRDLVRRVTRTVTLADGIVTPAGVVPRSRRFTVSGIYRVGMFEFDRRLAFINLNDAQRLYRFGTAGLSGCS